MGAEWGGGFFFVAEGVLGLGGAVGVFFDEPFVMAEEAGAVAEAVAEGDPVFFDERDEAVDGAEVGVEADLGEGGELRSAVPAVGAVEEDVRVFDGDLAHD